MSTKSSKLNKTLGKSLRALSALPPPDFSQRDMVQNHQHHLAPSGQEHYVSQEQIREAVESERFVNNSPYDAGLVMVGERHLKSDLAHMTGYLLSTIAKLRKEIETLKGK